MVQHGSNIPYSDVSNILSSKTLDLSIAVLLQNNVLNIFHQLFKNVSQLLLHHYPNCDRKSWVQSVKYIVLLFYYIVAMLHKCLVAVWLVCHNRAMLRQYHHLVIMETFQTMSKCIAAIVQCACSVVYFRHIKVFCYVVISEVTFEVKYSFLSARTAVG